MKEQSLTLSITIILCFLIFFQSCKDSSNNILIPNKNIHGQAIVGNSNSSVNYTPKGKFIQIIKPDSGIWKNVILKKNNEEIEPKLFFHDDDTTINLLYDKLSLGDYKLKYVSGLNDTIKEKLTFKESIKLEFPKKLNKFYQKLEIQDLNIKNLKVRDTLQLLYQSFGCFGGSESLIEFSITDDNEVNCRLKTDRYKRVGKSEEVWLILNGFDVQKELANFIDKAENLVKTDLDLCTSEMKYIFRIKGTNIITVVEDKSCELSDEIEQIIRKIIGYNKV